jgi:phosphate transport system permease protein
MSTKYGKLARHIGEFVIEKMIFLSGLITIAMVGLIFLFLLKESSSLFDTVTLAEFLGGTHWYPISDPPQFGVVALLTGSAWVTLGAMVIAMPLGIACAVYIAEVAPPFVREYLKLTVELLAAIPSVVFGFVGIVTIVPLVRSIFGLPTGLTGMAGSMVLAFMAMPTLVSIAEDSIRAVPSTYKEASLALGATEWQTLMRVIVPAASPGIAAAVMLALGRVIGETMAVMMVTGNAAVIPSGLLQPMRTLTATIAAEMGETVHHSDHYFALFAIGALLFLITFVINCLSNLFVTNVKKS